MKGRIALRMARFKHPKPGKTGYNHSRSPYPRTGVRGKHGNKQGFANTNPLLDFTQNK